MPYTYPIHSSPVPHTSIVVTITPSHSFNIHTCNTNKQYNHRSNFNHRIGLGYHNNLIDRPKTTRSLEHKPSSKSERYLIILQVNINGIKNKLEELELLIYDTHANIIIIQESKLTPKANTPKVHNFTTVRTDRLHNVGMGSLYSLETTLHSLPQTYIRPLILQPRTANGQGTH